MKTIFDAYSDWILTNDSATKEDIDRLDKINAKLVMKQLSYGDELQETRDEITGIDARLNNIRDWTFKTTYDNDTKIQSLKRTLKIISIVYGVSIVSLIGLFIWSIVR